MSSRNDDRDRRDRDRDRRRDDDRDDDRNKRYSSPQRRNERDNSSRSSNSNSNFRRDNDDGRSRSRTSPPRRHDRDRNERNNNDNNRNDNNRNDNRKRKREQISEEELAKLEYGNAESRADSNEKDNKSSKPKPQPEFHLSGKLAEEQRTLSNGTVLKFSEPIDKHMPTEKFVLIPFKDNKALETVYLDKSSCYLLGRDRSISDIALDHPSCSSQHAVIQFRQVKVETEEGPKKVVKPYLMDLQSTNGSFLNGDKIDDSRYYELREKDSIKFGTSTREFVLLRDIEDN